MHSHNPDSNNKIMVVDDDSYLLTAIDQTLTMHGYHVNSFDKPGDALESLSSCTYLAVIADVKMPLMDGLDFLQRIKEKDPDLPVILITGHGDVDMAVVAMKKGAYDFLEKPVDEDVLLSSLSRAVEKMQLILINRDLSRRLELSREKRDRFHGLIGSHPLMQNLYDAIQLVAAEDYPVLITGETGTGKELVARAIHDLSSRKGRPFVAVNMGAIPEDMLESELFGHEKGAFTGAGQLKLGKFEFAANGTLFLDEISNMPINLQAKLLRVLEDNAIIRLGANESIPMKARIITATNSDLVQELESGRFRRDLYFRLNVLPITVPPLRERKSDIPVLFKCFCDQYAHEHGLQTDVIDPETLHTVIQQDWPGNVRELKNYVKRLCVYRGSSDKSLSFEATSSSENLKPATISLRQAMDEAEKKHIMDVLRMYKGQIAFAHKALKISRKSLYDKINKYKLDLHSFRN
jgi:two-component system, NtrC family, C4-dicarboxylate transport response regulator DctD